ncbi:MAG: hypothetical protein JWQ90_3661 [Hydrocarboniphaga sp.]|uniref:hypothetical protein n=1 Tax=Hydrocarboniphaga sp. TaxID=2033016 RepID=UPI00261F1EB4|nr:hypothetical protein [Hydrocarboniphaga sp.]MDB5971211.1 hypothetical protein [Hydrocarboniphaga sp.]
MSRQLPRSVCRPWIAALLALGPAALPALAALADESPLGISRSSELHARLEARLDANDLARLADGFDATDPTTNDRWQNNASRNRYELQIAKRFKTAAGPCRSFELVATIDQHRTRVQGLACRKDDRWRVVE